MTFLLVHGSAQSPAGWRLLVDELARRGHQAWTVDLPTDDPSAGGAVYADAIAAALAERNLDDAIVVAHSVSGLFLPLVPARHPVRRLVFLASTLPRIGMSALDQLAADPSMLNRDWIGRNPLDDEVARAFLFHDCPPGVLDWAMTTRRIMFAQGALAEPCPLDAWPDTPSAYIVCAGDRTVSPAWSRRAARERLGVEAIELAGGHCPHVSRPAALAEILVNQL